MDLIARYSAESTEMTQALARAALEQTPEANVSCATTGHLEPDEGRVRDQPHVFVAISRRIDDAILEPATFERQLYEDTRIARQQECTMFAIRKLFEVGQALSQRKNQT